MVGFNVRMNSDETSRVSLTVGTTPYFLRLQASLSSADL